MRVHFIAVGGAVMHNLAITLHNRGDKVSGSDDEIFDPAMSRLARNGLLPRNTGWDPSIIGPDIDVVILGMHARPDNPELLKAQELGLRIYSFPEYMYEQTRNKIRVVIGGSHGKTTITAMVMHVLKEQGINFDYLAGSQVPGFDTMVGLSEESELAIFEGDEYLSSPIDPRPKFHIYKPRIALITGIAWDHMNVFPTFEEYVEQFRIFTSVIEPGGTLIFYQGDPLVKTIANDRGKDTRSLGYLEHLHHVENGTTFLDSGSGKIRVNVFGRHNMQNIKGAQLVCRELGIGDDRFYRAITSFPGAARRLQLIREEQDFNFYLDFAHAPSKLKATTQAVKEQYPNTHLVACIELHTFSSLNPEFFGQYHDTFSAADSAIVFYNPETLEHKKLPPIRDEQLKKAFNRSDIVVLSDRGKLEEYLTSQDWRNKNLLMMSSGNFSGMDIQQLAVKLK